jgi:hypothetical protein
LDSAASRLCSRDVTSLLLLAFARHGDGDRWRCSANEDEADGDAADTLAGRSSS